MTVIRSVQKEAKGRTSSTFCSIFLLLFVFIFAFFFSGRISESVISGMRFAIFTIIPSAYPFMIIGDLYVAIGAPEKIRPLGAVLTRLFGISEAGLRALICGTVAGFPLGAKISAELYTGGDISREEAEILVAISNNPSIPFVTAAVGGAIFNDVRIGAFLLIIIYISTVLTANVFRRHSIEYTRSASSSGFSFDFTASVKNAATASLNIVAFVTFFFSVVGAVSLVVKGELVSAVISSLLEVTTAVNSASSLSLPLSFRLSLTAFALGFGGLSVMMQSSVFTKEAGLSLKKYFILKLTEGLIAALITAVSLSLFPLF